LQEHDKFQHLQKRDTKKKDREGQWPGSVTGTGSQDEEPEVPHGNANGTGNGNGEPHLRFQEHLYIFSYLPPHSPFLTGAGLVALTIAERVKTWWAQLSDLELGDVICAGWYVTETLQRSSIQARVDSASNASRNGPATRDGHKQLNASSECLLWILNPIPMAFGLWQPCKVEEMMQTCRCLHSINAVLRTLHRYLTAKIN
jgi:hypothetical protein